MVSKLKQRLASDEGFTLIELLVVIVILGILLAIAVPSYLGFKDRANKAAAKSNVRAALPAAEAYYSDQGNYASMTLATLKAHYDTGIKIRTVKVLSSGSSYCIDALSGNYSYEVTNPGGNITAGHC